MEPGEQRLRFRVCYCDSAAGNFPPTNLERDGGAAGCVVLIASCGIGCGGIGIGIGIGGGSRAASTGWGSALGGESDLRN